MRASCHDKCDRKKVDALPALFLAFTNDPWEPPVHMLHESCKPPLTMPTTHGSVPQGGRRLPRRSARTCGRSLTAHASVQKRAKAQLRLTHVRATGSLLRRVLAGVTLRKPVALDISGTARPPAGVHPLSRPAPWMRGPWSTLQAGYPDLCRPRTRQTVVHRYPCARKSPWLSA